MRRRLAAAAPAIVAGVSGALSIGSLVFARLNGETFGDFLAGNQANMWLAGLAFGLVATLVLHSRPANRLGPVFAAAGLFTAIASIASEYATYTLVTRPHALPAGNLAAWVGTVFWMPGFLIALVGLPLLFPDGRLPSPRWRWPARVALVAGSVAVVSIATTQYIVDDGYPMATNPFDLPIPDGPQVAVTIAGFFTALAVGAAAVVAIVVRMRHLGQPRRQQYAWFVAGVALSLIVGPLTLPDVVTFAANALSIAAFGVGIVRYRLFDIEVVLSRGLVYALLTAGALAAYLATALLIGANLGAEIWPAVAAAVAALLLAGVRQRLQHAVDHLLYGQRTDPLGALTALGEQLGGAIDTDAVLPAVVSAVRRTLRLPYAAVQLTGETSPACAAGEPPAHTADFPLAHAGIRVGTLVVGLRRGETALAPADSDLLTAFARQVGVAAHGVRVTRDLRRSRERIVVAREEERRRLRRELHDGLGPALAGITLGLETAARRAKAPLAGLLSSLRDETAACVDEVRKLSADLRPAVLDQIGLVPALRQHADLLTSRSAGRFAVEVSEPSPVPALPAAAESAAYRIVLEAITNAARHAAATTCRVSVELNGSLYLTVSDDGTGVPASPPGVGLASMRERAEELGGTCTVVFREGEGARVEAVLPVKTP